jgi:hypothetical protein
MAKILTRLGTRCVEHPHRPTERLCDRCGRPFCAPCLVPGPRAADGTREWCCRPCRAARRAESAAALAARSWRGRAAWAGRGALALVPLLAAAGAVAAALALAVRADRPGAAVPLAACGELTRIRSVGAIGTQAAEDAVNVLAYPQRAEVRLGAGGAGPGADGTAAALVDECQSGWRSAGPRALPVEVVLDTRRPGSAVQRLALWQDPGAPRGAWVRDFEALASPSADGDDFQAIPLDRPGRLRETTEPQWFEVQRPAPGATGASFPDVVPLRRLRLRLLSTYGDPAGGPAVATGAAPGGVALGEVAAYGPDLEVVLAHPTALGGEDLDRFVVGPAEIRALALQPKFVLFLNRTRTSPHTLVSVGQTRNFEVTIPPGEARAVQFTAGAPGRYEFYCRVPGHDRLGLSGSIVVR